MAKKLKKRACKRVGVGNRCLCRVRNKTGKLVYQFAKNSRCSKAKKRSKKSK